MCLYVHVFVIDREQIGNINFIFARQQFGSNSTEAKNTNAKIEESLDAKFSMRASSYQEKYTIGSYHNFGSI
jgi:hypothetical protein